jgi:hypothetical protein
MSCALNSPSAAVLLDTVGVIDAATLEYAKAQVGRVARDAPDAVQGASLQLKVADGSPLAVAKARLQVHGQPVRAHVASPTATEAVDRAAARLTEQLATMCQQPAAPTAGRTQQARGWVFGASPTTRPGYTNRGAADPSIARRKTYDNTPCTPEAAIVRAALLEYDFYLFVDENTRRPAVVRRRDSNVWQQANPTNCSVSDAINMLGVSNARFVFFIDTVTSTLHALYRRYDGDYGLLSPER